MSNQTKERVFPRMKPKRCPFCGEKPRVYPIRPAIEGNAFGMVACINDECPAQPKVEDGENCCDDRGSGAYKDAAIKRWNRRVK